MQTSDPVKVFYERGENLMKSAVMLGVLALGILTALQAENVVVVVVYPSRLRSRMRITGNSAITM